MEKQAVITATDLCIGYRTHKGEKKVHEHLSFRLYPGELTSLQIGRASCRERVF